METRILGGMTVSALGLGCMGFSGFYGSVNDDESIATIHAALDSGITLLDTADFLEDGANEELVGRAIAGRQSEVAVATHTGINIGAAGLSVDVRPREFRDACDASLRRLGVERIELYVLARVDPKVPIEECVGAMAELVRAGKVAHIGLSEASPATLRRAHDIYPISVVQTEYSLWERHVEVQILPAAQKLGIGFMAYSPLGRGFLAGGVRSSDDLGPTDYRRIDPRFDKENFEHNRQLVAPLAELARDKGITMSQLALAWLLARGNSVTAIFGTRRKQHVADNVAASEVKLTAAEIAYIDELLPAGSAAGERYPVELDAQIDRT